MPFLFYSNILKAYITTMNIHPLKGFDMNNITRGIDNLEVLAYSDELTKKLENIQAIFGEEFCLFPDLVIHLGLGKKPMIVKADKAHRAGWLWDIYFDDHSFRCGTQFTFNAEKEKVNDLIMKYLFGKVPTTLGHICFETTTVQ